MTDATVRYRCPECQHEDDWPAHKKAPYCGICAGDCGTDVLMSRVLPDLSDVAKLLAGCAKGFHHFVRMDTVMHYANERHLICAVCDSVVSLPTINGKVVADG